MSYVTHTSEAERLSPVFQESGPAWCGGLSPSCSFTLLPAAQFASGDLRNAGEGDRCHGVWSVLGLRLFFPLPQAGPVVSDFKELIASITWKRIT